MKRSSDDRRIVPANKPNKNRRLLSGEKAKALDETGDVAEKLSHKPGGTDFGAANALSEKTKRFPDRLFELLNTEAVPASLYWLPGGKAFAIEQEDFDKKVLDKYFQATKFASFVRRLHKWGFRRETRGFRKEIGPDLSRSVIAFSHTLFQKEAPDLVSQMVEVAKRPQSNSEVATSTPSRKRESSGGLQTSATSQKLASASSPSTFPENVTTARSIDRTRTHQGQFQGFPEGVESAFPSASAIQRSLLGNTIDQQILLHNLRGHAFQHRERDPSYELLLRSQHQNNSLLQRSMLTASFAQQQQQHLPHQRATLAAATAASNNQAIFDAAAARERLLQMNRANSSLPHAPFPSRAASLLGQIDSARQPRSTTENNNQLMETLFLLELQRQQQGQQGQQDQQPPGGGGGR